MDYQSFIQLMTSNKTLVKKVTPFLVSVSVFSFIFSNSWWHSFLFPFLKFYFSSLPMQVLSHALDKTWIFLICNGIVVVIANTSSTVQYSQSGFDHLNDIKIGDNSLQPPLLDAKGNSLELPAEPDNINVVCGLEEKENDAAEEEQEKRNPSLISVDYGEEAPHAEQENEFIVKGGGGEETPELEISCIMGDNDEENHHEEESETCLMMMMTEEEEEEEEEEEDQQQLYDYEEAEEAEEEEEEGGGMDKLSTEELNKKFEDFIRKMKEELRIQAQQQLILSC